MKRTPKLSSRAKAVAYTLVAGALWGTSFPIIKIGLETIDPFTFLFWRFLISCVALFAVMMLLKKLQFKITDKKLIISLGIANAAGYLLQYVGMPYTTAAKAALFINLSAMWVAILSPRLLGEKISPQKVAGVLCGLLGIVFVSTNLDFATLTQGQILADSLLLVSGITWALFMIYNKKLIMNSTSATFQAMSWVLAFTFISLAPFAVLSGPNFLAIDSWAWAAIIYQAVLCWVVPYYLWLEGLKHLSASTSTVLLLSEIVVAVIASIVLLQEPITIFSSIGALLIIAAIVLVSINRSKNGHKPQKSTFAS